MAVAALGVGAVMVTLPQIFVAMTVLGETYLIFLAVTPLRSGKVQVGHAAGATAAVFRLYVRP
ncbi:hypothetical protein WS87_00825 (plasmid) [Burkholderia sp. MSMB0856]|nr:hypothetical protein WS87_00825 [Burkholderia sp. MSMB0856]